MNITSTYKRFERSFGALRRDRRIVLGMTLRFITGTEPGGLLLGVIADVVLVPALALLLLLSVVKVWWHK